MHDRFRPKAGPRRTSELISTPSSHPAEARHDASSPGVEELQYSRRGIFTDFLGSEASDLEQALASVPRQVADCGS